MSKVLKKEGVSSGALAFFSGTLVSRFSGLLRDMSMAYFFGPTLLLGSFFVVYRWIYLFRRLFGETLLQQGFVPHFEMLQNQGPKKGAQFFRDVFWSLTLFLAGLVMLGECILFFLPSSTVLLGRLMCPGILFICLFGLNASCLFSLNRFFLPSSASVFFNLVWITGALTCGVWANAWGFEPVYCLAFFISCGCCVQWLVTFIGPYGTFSFVKKHLKKEELLPTKETFSSLKKLAKPAMLGIIGIGAVQINSALDAVFAQYASCAGETGSGPVYLWYAIRIYQLPLALFAISFASALLPALCRSVASLDGQNAASFSSVLTSGVIKTLSWIIPCTFALFPLAFCGINLLFGRGAFNPHSVIQTGYCLWGYAFGLIPAALCLVLCQGFYAKKDYKTPAIGFCFCALINILLNTLMVFVFDVGVFGIAFATSLSAWIQAIYLGQKLPLSLNKTSWIYLGKLGAVGLLCVVATTRVSSYLFYGLLPVNFWKQLVCFGVQGSCFLLLLLGFCYLMKVGPLHPSSTT